MRIKKYNEYNFKVPQEVIDLSDIFTSNGKKLYIVGGYVRDTIMGLSPLDIDLATDSLPEETMQVLEGKYKMDLVGKAFGVIIVHLGKMKIEIASFRKDITSGRHPEVKLGVSIEDDVNRRDISISALFYDIQEGKIVDLVGGINDIKNKIIKMVGDPKERLQEDQLRSLRCIRFACRYNFKFDPKTKEDLKRYTDLSKISKERIWEEFKKSFEQSINFTEYLEMLDEFDLFKQIFPNSKINTKIEDTKYLETYLANLFKLENTNALERKMVQNWKIEIPTARKAIFLINLRQLDIDNWIDLYKSKVRCNIDNETILEWYKVNDMKKEAFYAFYSFVDYKPFVSAEDLKSQGWKEGPELGKEIRRLEMEKIREMI